MAARAFWSGRLRLALVTIPVEIVPATKSASRISFHQIHEPSGKRIRYEKVVPGIGPIDADDIVKGYEVENGKYVLLTDDDKRTLPLGIMHFTGSHQLDVGMVATGLMIAMVPVIVLYAFFSETMIRGMTAGAVR